MKVFLKLIIALSLLALIGCQESSSPMGGNAKKSKKQESSPAPIEPIVEGHSDNAGVAAAPPVDSAGGQIVDESIDDEEFAEEPSNILGSFLTVNRIGEEDDGKTIRLGLTLVDNAGNKVPQRYDLSYNFPETVEGVTTEFEELDLDRAYHAVGLIKAESAEIAEKASGIIHFSATTEVDGEKVAAKTSGSTAVEGERQGDAGGFDSNFNPPN